MLERAWGFESLRPHCSSPRCQQLTRFKSVPFGKINSMKSMVRRVASIAAAGLAPLAFVTVISPAVSHADCAFGTEYLDPIANVCRPTGAPLKNCLPGGWWDPTIADCRPF